MKILIYSVLMVLANFALLVIGNKLIDKGRNPVAVIILLLGLLFLSLIVAFAMFNVQTREVVLAWLN